MVECSAALSPRSLVKTRISHKTDDEPRPALVGQVEFSKPRRNFPVAHLGREAPLCENCRAMGAKLLAPGSDHVMLEQIEGYAHQLREASPQLTEEELVRIMLDGKVLNGSWWCDKCQNSLMDPSISIAELFAILRQWTPQAQLQLATVVEEMFRRGANVNDRDGLTDMTLLHYTAKCGALGDEETALRIAEYLLDQGAELDARCGWTDMAALHYAAYFDCPTLAELFVSRGADLYGRSGHYDGATALHLAAAQLSLATTKTLLQADKSHPERSLRDELDDFGRTPFECLPPASQLPEPLATIRNRLAEILGRPTLLNMSYKLEKSDFTTMRRDKAASVPPEAAATSAQSGTGSASPAMDQEFRMFKLRPPTASPSPFSKRSTSVSQQPSFDVDPHANPDLQVLFPPRDDNPAEYRVRPGMAETGVLSPRFLKNTASRPATGPESTRLPLARNSVSACTSPYSRKLTATKPRFPTARQAPARPVDPQAATSATVSAKVTLQSLGLALGDRVCIGASSAVSSGCSQSKVNGRMGVLRYCGPVEFASGVWVGVELDQPMGRNNGTVANVNYFTCEADRGIFAPIGRVYKYENETQLRPVSGRRASGQQPRPATPKNALPDGLDGTHLVNRPIDVSHVSAKVNTNLRATSQEEAAPVFSVGDRVLVAGLRKGYIRFIGETDFAPGIWHGVELDKAAGKNDGSVNGKRYFSCGERHGIFAPAARLQRLPDRSNTPDGRRFSATSSEDNNNAMMRSFHGELGACDRDSQTSSSSGRSGRRSTMNSPASSGTWRKKPSVPTFDSNGRTGTPSGASTPSQAPPFLLKPGLVVLCAGEIATLRYVGPVDFTEGVWLGLELRQPRGRHDGFVAGRRYFTCRTNHGVLVRPSRVTCRGINAARLLPPEMAAINREAMERLRQANGTPSQQRTQ